MSLPGDRTKAIQSVNFVCSSCACLMRPPSRDTKVVRHITQCMLCVLCAHVQFCWFDKADATAEVQRY